MGRRLAWAQCSTSVQDRGGCALMLWYPYNEAGTTSGTGDCYCLETTAVETHRSGIVCTINS